jgi:hypothetical protein
MNIIKTITIPKTIKAIGTRPTKKRMTVSITPAIISQGKIALKTGKAGDKKYMNVPTTINERNSINKACFTLIFISGTSSLPH